MDYDLGPDVHALPASSTDTPPARIEYKMVEELDTDFKRKYPPDLLGREMEDGARVWMVYRDEATANDSTMIDGWSKTIDILLIFAGLFSAVATAFVVESYKLLQLDSEAYTANALYLILNSTSSSPSLPALPLPPGLDTSPSSLSRWINGLWFMSLILSLAVALLCILVKQWIGEYTARNNASARSPRHWARRHQVYFQAMSRWPVAEFVSVLPLLLHLALFLFFAGTVAFLWTLDRAISVMVIVLGSTLAVFYAVCTFIPLWIPDCPTSTPVANQIRRQFAFFRRLALQSKRSMFTAARRLRNATETYIQQWATSRQPVVEPSALSDRARQSVTFFDPYLGREIRFAAPSRLPDLSLVPRASASTDLQADDRRAGSLDPPVKRAPVHSWDQGTPDARFIAKHVDGNRDALDHDALMWLILAVSDTDANAVGRQALGALGPTSALVKRIRHEKRLGSMTPSNAVTRTSATLTANELMRAVRSQLCVQQTGQTLTAFERWPILNTLIDENHPDLCLFWSVMHPEYLPTVRASASQWRKTSSSLTSTAILLLRTNSPLTLGPETARSSCELHCLLCCRLEDMSDQQWRIIFHSLRSRDLPRLPSILREVWLIDIVARQIRLVKRDEGGIRAGLLVMERLLDLLARKLTKDTRGSTVLLNVGRLEDLSYLTAFFAGLQQRLQLNLERCTAILHILLGATDKAQLHYVDTIKYFVALVKMLQVHRPFLQLRGDGPRSIHDLVCQACCHAFPDDADEELGYHPEMSGGAHRELAARSDRTRLSVVLERILNPIPNDGDRPPLLLSSLWEMIWREPTSYSFIGVVEHVVSSLCIRRRKGCDVADMVDDFFSELDFSKLLLTWDATFGRAWQTLHESMHHAPPTSQERRHRFYEAVREAARSPEDLHFDIQRMLHVVQHCVELRPQWWMEFLITVTPDEGPRYTGVRVDLVCGLAHVLDELLPVHGPCRVCPGTPVGWADEWDDQQDSPDCFYPAIPHPAIAHLPLDSRVERREEHPFAEVPYVFGS